MNFSTTREQSSLEITELTERENNLTSKIIGAAIDVHRALGPGLLESAYEACLVYELRLRKLRIESQKAIPIVYKDVMLDCGYRADLIVNDQVIFYHLASGGIEQRIASGLPPERKPNFVPRS